MQRREGEAQLNDEVGGTKEAITWQLYWDCPKLCPSVSGSLCAQQHNSRLGGRILDHIKIFSQRFETGVTLTS